MSTKDNIFYCFLALLVIMTIHHLNKLERQVFDLQERIEMLEKR